MAKLVVIFLAFAAFAAIGDSLPRFPPKQIHLRFFWHEKSIGSDATAVVVAKSNTTDISPTEFGTIRVMDAPLTVGPKESSELIGRSQGIYLAADQKVDGLLMIMTLSFTGTKYKGSTLAVVGRNEISLPVRQMPIVGGSGEFACATGYVQASHYSDDRANGKFIIEYNCYISYPSLTYFIPQTESFGIL